jgi:uncharacterized membrane protein YdjX (TVP38/TMEM64 family)
MQPPALRRIARRRLLLLALGVAAAFGSAVAFLPHDPAELARFATLPVPVLVAAALAAWTLVTPAMVSGTPLAAGTGLLLGGLAGTPVSLLGATLGGAIAFLVARRLGSGPAEAAFGFPGGRPRVALTPKWRQGGNVYGLLFPTPQDWQPVFGYGLRACS